MNVADLEEVDIYYEAQTSTISLSKQSNTTKNNIKHHSLATSRHIIYAMVKISITNQRYLSFLKRNKHI